MDKRQRQFCRLAAEGIDPEDAAKLAGYRRRGVEKILLASEKIQAAIAAEKERREKRDGEESAGREEILSFLTELMRDSKETDVKTRMRAAELLARRAGIFEKDSAEGEEKRVVIVDDIP